MIDWEALLMKLILAILCFFTTFALNAETILHPTQGEAISFSELKGKWVLINYWASWCEPCLEEIHELNQFYDQHKKEEIVLFAVNYDMLSKKKQQQMATKYHLHYPALLEDPAASLHLGDIQGVPVTFIFNPQGELSETLYGGQTAEGLNNVLKKHNGSTSIYPTMRLIKAI